MNKLILVVALFATLAFASISPAVIAAQQADNIKTLVAGTDLVFSHTVGGDSDNDAQTFIVYEIPADTAKVHVTYTADTGDGTMVFYPNNIIGTNSTWNFGSNDDSFTSGVQSFCAGLCQGDSQTNTYISMTDAMITGKLYMTVITSGVSGADETTEYTLTITEFPFVDVALVSDAAGVALTGTSADEPIWRITNPAEDYISGFTTVSGDSLTWIGGFNKTNGAVNYAYYSGTWSATTLAATLSVPTAQIVIATFGTEQAVTFADGTSTPQIYEIQVTLTEEQANGIFDIEIVDGTGSVFTASQIEFLGAMNLLSQPMMAYQTGSYYDSISGTNPTYNQLQNNGYYVAQVAGTFSIYFQYTGAAATTATINVKAGTQDTQVGTFCAGADAANVTSVAAGICTCAAGTVPYTCAAIPAAPVAPVIITGEGPANGETTVVTLVADQQGWNFPAPTAVSAGAIYVAGIYDCGASLSSFYLWNGLGGGAELYTNAAPASGETPQSDYSLVASAGSGASISTTFASTVVADETFTFIHGWGTFGAEPESAAFAVNPVVFVVLAALSLVALF